MVNYSSFANDANCISAKLHANYPVTSSVCLFKAVNIHHFQCSRGFFSFLRNSCRTLPINGNDSVDKNKSRYCLVFAVMD